MDRNFRKEKVLLGNLDNTIGLVPRRNGRLRVSQNGDFEPPADPQIEALVLHLELKNEDSTPSIEGRPRCPADFVK
ncbi:hypothetical protein TNCT_91961 [Trichonephila clavata]|uniref:Uncharacterized protein n=1 Tax=Trichonephila clavata TaxID=2740835 RepID=A0A8X6JBD1_TRICU|nr:hypothetical protein TNCT_91961 [Trichonephila clavata]